MRLIRPSYEIINQEPGMQGIYDIIERCGKISYKSEAKGGETARKFVEARLKEKHGAVLEFGTVYLTVPYGIDEHEIVRFYEANQYSRVNSWDDGQEINYYITTNYRVIAEKNRFDDLRYLCEPTEFHARRYTVKFITDIGVGREFLRHRVMSPLQESTRYVNYMKEKFGEQCTFVIPPWISREKLGIGENVSWWDDDWVDTSNMKIVKVGPAELEADPVEVWLNSMSAAETSYRLLINFGWTPEQARTVLPLSTKTEYALCGYKDAWVHFFRLRSDIAATGKPHPQAEEIANPLREHFLERQYITREDLQHEAFGAFDVCISDTVLKH